MRFLSRSFLALLMAALTLVLLAGAAQVVLSAREAREGDGGPRGGGGPREQVFAVGVVAAVAGEERPVITAFGEVRAARALELRAPAGGRVVALAPGFREGGRVEAGEVLVEIDPSDAADDLALARADLAEAEAGLRDAERRLALAVAEREQSEAQAALQLRALERQRALGDRGVGTAAALEAAELASGSAEAAVLSRRQAEAQAEAAVDAARTALERRRIALGVAERALGDRVLRAAFGGVLADVAVVDGGLVVPNERLADLVDPEALEVAVRLSAAQRARLGAAVEGRPVRAVLDAMGLDAAAEGEVTREAAAAGEGGTGRLLFAELRGAGALRPGDFVRVEIAEPPLANVVRLPATALAASGEVLAVGADERLEAVAVRLLRRQGDDVLVEGTPIEGREVVAERTPALGAGVRVRPVRPEAAAGTVALDPERRARLLALVEASMPEGDRAALAAELRQDRVPAETVARIEARAGG